MVKNIVFILLFVLVFVLIVSGCSKKVEVDDSIQSEKISKFYNSQEFTTPKQLKALMEDDNKDVVVIGVLDPTRALIPGNISSSPIEGSYTVWRPDYSGAGSNESISTDIGGYRRSKEEVEILLSKAGATESSSIVIYTADTHHDTGRLLWQIKLLGHKDVKYLDGGLNAWIGAGYPTSKANKLVDEDVKTDYKAASYKVGDMDADIKTLTEALSNPDEWVVIDTRTKDEFDGLKTGSSKGAFGTGRIKGTIHINWTEAVNDDDTTLKSIDELNEIYGEVIKDKKVIVFCQSGVRSAFTYMVLTNVLGADNVYNYDGSWIEWSYTASSASEDNVDDALRTEVLTLTEEWSDNNQAIN